MFLRLPLEDCLNMMAPVVWSSGSVLGTISQESVPAETLSLWDNVSDPRVGFGISFKNSGPHILCSSLRQNSICKCVIAADHEDDLFVWSGQGTLEPKYDSIRQDFKTFLQERSKNRFPMPKLHMLKEGDSMSRRFTSRLSPSHADPPEQQLAHFPALSTLSADELTALRSKFRFYDPVTDPSFRSWFWGVASATSSSKDVGLSLCE